MLIFFCIFWFIWNFRLGTFGAFLVTRICREGINRENCVDTCIRIICPPHTLIGIIVPILYVRYGDFYLHEKVIFLIVTLVIPYSFWTITINWWGEGEELRELRSTPCFSCLRCAAHNDRETQAIEVVAEEHTEDTRIIYKKVVQGDGRVQSRHSKNCSFRSRHPKSDIVVNGHSNHCLENESLQTTFQTRVQQQIFDEESLFPIPLNMEDRNESDCSFSTAIEDLYPWDEKIVEDPLEQQVAESISNSVQICNICLEEYKVGEKIGWSKNDECYHAFHKDCIIEWLANHDECPICRNKY